MFCLLALKIIGMGRLHFLGQRNVQVCCVSVTSPSGELTLICISVSTFILHDCQGACHCLLTRFSKSQRSSCSRLLTSATCDTECHIQLGSQLQHENPCPLPCALAHRQGQTESWKEDWAVCDELELGKSGLDLGYHPSHFCGTRAGGHTLGHAASWQLRRTNHVKAIIHTSSITHHALKFTNVRRSSYVHSGLKNS